MLEPFRQAEQERFSGMSGFIDSWWQSADGLRLHYRDYPGAADGARVPVLCLHGLTRNARDFDGLAASLASPEGGGWRVLCPDMRGRGQSEYAGDTMTYTPPHYVGDVLGLLDQAGIAQVVVIGTSLGGLMAMGLALVARERLAGVVLNDIGPVIEAAGLAKIGGYVGADHRFASWAEGVAALRGTFASAYPGWGKSDWLTMAHRLMVEDAGTIRFDYDPRIAEPFFAAAAADPPPPAPDLWPGLEALGGLPLLMLRGGVSDILSEATLAEMARRLPDAYALTLPDIGHAPTLDEPEAVAAITRLLEAVA